MRLRIASALTWHYVAPCSVFGIRLESNAKNSLDGLCRQAIAGLRIPCAALCCNGDFRLRRQHFSMLHRLVRNFVLSIPGFAIVRLAMLPIPTRDRDVGAR